MDGYDEVRDLETHETIFSTKLDKDIIEYTGRYTMIDEVIDNVVNIWNKTGKIDLNLGPDGELDKYLLDEENCTQDEREIIVKSLFDYANE
jgi:hypothetical protein